jgi:hypothetical protein
MSDILAYMFQGVCFHDSTTDKCIVTPYSSTYETINKTLSLQFDEQVIKTALNLQQNVFLSFENVAAITFFVSLFLLLLRKSVKITQQSWRIWHFVKVKWAETMLLVSISISLINGVSVTQVRNALEFSTIESRAAAVWFRAGRTLQILEWLASGVSVLFFAALVRFCKHYSADSSQKEQIGKHGDFPLSDPAPFRLFDPPYGVIPAPPEPAAWGPPYPGPAHFPC